MVRITKLILAILLSLSYQQAFAQGAGVNSGSQFAQQQAAKAANDNYKKGKRDLTVGAALMASMFTIVPGTILVLKGIQQMKQGNAMAKGSADSGFSARGSSYAGGDFEKSLLYKPADFSREINQAKENLAKYGYSYDDKTNSIKTPDGNTWDANTFSGGADEVALKAGVSEEDAQKALDELKKHKDKSVAQIGKGDMKVSSTNSAAATATSDFDPNSIFGSRPANRTIAAAKTTGLTKNIGGDTVGTSQDNIFQMVRRKYENKKSESFFIEGDWGL